MENNGGSNKIQVHILNSFNLISYQFIQPRELIMLYKIILEGSGGEIMIGKVTQAEYDYWSDKESEEIRDALNGYGNEDEIPEDAWIDDRFNFMDVFCSSGVYVNNFDLSIAEVDPDDEDADDAYYVWDGFDHLESELGNKFIEVIKYPADHKTYLCSIDGEIGILLEEEFELDEKLDTSKLQVRIATLHDGSKLIVGIDYDGLSLGIYGDDFEKTGSMEASVYSL